MCRSLRVLCAAADPERVEELRRAAVGAHWELVGGAASLKALEDQVAEWQPDVVVVDAALGEAALTVVRRIRPSIRIVALGTMSGADAEAAWHEDVRAAILGLPRPGGPVRT
jgi:AmiR/NasT family two-component response regulator